MIMPPLPQNACEGNDGERRPLTNFGYRLQTREVGNQFKELLLKCAILNQMTHLGMPDSVQVTC
jgi:hypothetical protein